MLIVFDTPEGVERRKIIISTNADATTNKNNVRIGSSGQLIASNFGDDPTAAALTSTLPLYPDFFYFIINILSFSTLPN